MATTSRLLKRVYCVYIKSSEPPASRRHHGSKFTNINARCRTFKHVARAV